MSGKVTEVSVEKRNKERVNIYIDDEYSFSCELELACKYGIEKGKKIDQSEIIEISREDDFSKAKNCALYALERSLKSESEISSKLVSKGFNEETINRVLIFLKSYGFVDDDRYVKVFIDEKISSCGKKKLQYSLKEKGIKEEVIEAQLNMIAESTERKFAFLQGEKKLAIIMKSETDKKKLYGKLVEFLIRRGYSYALVKEVVDTLLGDIDEEFKEKENNIDEGNEKLIEIATKRYAILLKSENDSKKIYKKLWDFLLRKGYKWEQVKEVLDKLVLKVGDC